MSTFLNGHALLIGIGSYQNSPSYHVPATAVDAQAVARIVKDTQYCGYPADQVAVLHDERATRAGILAALDQLAQTREDDTVMLFYSGHGEYDAGGNYTLTTYDTRWQAGRVVPGSAISQAELLTKLRAIPAARVLLLFNACHAGMLSPTLGAAPPTGQPLPQQTASALLSTGSGRIVITACREQQYAFIGPGPQTLFAQALVEGLRGGGEVYNRAGYISAFDLYTHLYDALKEAVQRDVPQATRTAYGGTQEPELTILKGVGPFAVALYRGATTLGNFPADHAPADNTAVRTVEPTRSQRALQHIVATVTVQGDNQGQAVGVNYGTMTQTRQDIHNEAPNQGAQGMFHGPVTFQQQHSTSNQQGQRVQGDQYNAAHDLIQSGDNVRGDTISSDITTRNVAGSGIAIGHKTEAQGQVQPGGDPDALARAFAQIYRAITARAPDADVDKDEITRTVQAIEQEAQQGDRANEKKLARWLHQLAEMAEDIFDSTVNVLTGPQAACATVARTVAARVEQEHERG